MFKRGQVSASVIVGISILIILGMLIVLYQQGYFSKISEVSKSTELKGQAEDVKTVLGKCFEDRLLQAIYMIGLTGGHLATANPSLNLARGLDVGYGYFLRSNEMPTKEEIELEIDGYLNFVVPKCLGDNNVSGFIVVNNSAAKTRVSIFDDRIEGKLSYPVTVSKGDVKYNYEDLYNAGYDIRLGRLNKFALDIVNNEISGNIK